MDGHCSTDESSQWAVEPMEEEEEEDTNGLGTDLMRASCFL